MSTDLQATIEAAWDARETLGLTTTGATVLVGLDKLPRGATGPALLPGKTEAGYPVRDQTDVSDKLRAEAKKA